MYSHTCKKYIHTCTLHIGTQAETKKKHFRRLIFGKVFQRNRMHIL